MDVRPIRGDELDVFACFSEQEEINNHLAQYLADLWATGTSRPEWCFVTEDAGQISGRVVYWALPTCPVPSVIDFLDVPWRGDYCAVGEGLLRETLRHFRTSGAEGMKYELILPSWFSAFPEQRTELLTRVGFVLRREGDRWEWTTDTTTPPSTTRLTFRPVTEVGEEVLISAVARTLEGTRDRGLQADRRRWGAEEAARRYVQASKALRDTPGWWQLAYTPDHALVGVIMPSQNDGGPIIDYVGVVPEQRGRGHVNDLLAKGIAELQADGAARIRSDSDTGNTAMARAFRQTGFKRFRTRVVYEIELSGWSAGR